MSFAVSAEAYDRFMGRFSAPLAEAFVAEAGIVGGMRVLDVGSGPGALSRALVDVVGPGLVAAVDPQPAFVEALAGRLPGVTATVGSAESLPHEDATVDACLAILVVHFMADPVAGLREMARVTRPGGTVAATVWQHALRTSPISPFWLAVRAFDPDAPDESERPGTTQGSLVRLMAEAGVSAPRESTLTVGGTFDDFATEWRDTHIRLTGPAVWDLKRAFADFWNLHRRRLLGQSERPLLLETAASWEPRVRVHRNVPRLWMFPIRGMYLEAINRASRNVWLTQAYFLPDQDFVDALVAAARRGVDVRLLVPLKSNHVVADWISRGYYDQLLRGGVRILRFQGAMVHAKTATVDGSWSTVGTANIDRLSLQGNYEINVEVIDAGLARTLEEIFETDQSNCLELTLSEWSARDLHRRFTELVLNPLRPLL
jgi:SAM-dependent methyltransferase